MSFLPDATSSLMIRPIFIAEIVNPSFVYQHPPSQDPAPPFTLFSPPAPLRASCNSSYESNLRRCIMAERSSAYEISLNDFETLVKPPRLVASEERFWVDTARQATTTGRPIVQGIEERTGDHVRAIFEKEQWPIIVEAYSSGKELLVVGGIGSATLMIKKPTERSDA